MATASYEKIVLRAYAGGGVSAEVLAQKNCNTNKPATGCREGRSGNGLVGQGRREGEKGEGGEEK